MAMTITCQICNTKVPFDQFDTHMDTHLPDVAISYYSMNPVLMYKVQHGNRWHYEAFNPQPPHDLLRRSLEEVAGKSPKSGFYPVSAEVEEYLKKAKAATS